MYEADRDAAAVGAVLVLCAAIVTIGVALFGVWAFIQS